MRLSPQLATDLLGGHGDWGDAREEAGACLGRSGKVLSGTAWACFDWDGVHRELPVVCGDGHDSGARRVDRRRGEDSCLRRAPAEARPAGRGADSAVAVGGAVSAHLDTVRTGEGAAAPGDEPGHHEKAKAVEQSGREGAARAAVETVG